MSPDCLSSLSQRTETDRCSPFVIATNDALEKLEHLDIQGLKRAPEGAERFLFLANHQNEIQISGGDTASHSKPHIVIMRCSDAAGAYPSPLLMEEEEQQKNIISRFHRILSCVELKTTRSDLIMTDFLRNHTPWLDEMDPMHFIVGGPAIRAAEAAEKESQVESWATKATSPGGECQKRPHEPVDAGNNSESQSRHSRAAKRSSMAPKVALPTRTAGSASQTSTSEEKTPASKTQAQVLQAGSYAVRMLSMSPVHTWNLLIIGTCPSLDPRKPLLTVTGERVYILYYDRQGHARSYSLNILKSLPHFLVLLLAFPRLDLEGWRFAPNLSHDTDSNPSAQLVVTLGNLVRQPAARVEFPADRVRWAHWGLVGRATEAYEFDLTDHRPKEQVVKLGRPKVIRTPETEIFKELGEIPDEASKRHILDLLAFQMPTVVDTRLIHKRLAILPQAHFPESLIPRRLVFTVCQTLLPVWDLTLDGFFDVWVEALFCMLDSSMSSVHD